MEAEKQFDCLKIPGTFIGAQIFGLRVELATLFRVRGSLDQIEQGKNPNSIHLALMNHIYTNSGPRQARWPPDVASGSLTPSSGWGQFIFLISLRVEFAALLFSPS